MRKYIPWLLILLLAAIFFLPSKNVPDLLDKHGKYYQLEDVTRYLQEYERLPHNFMTKEEARQAGWVPSQGNLWEVTDKACIGGDVFRNREGLLPDKKGRIWYECDIDYQGGPRGPKRLVYSNDGLYYYTSDHYKSFQQIGGKP